MVKNQKVLRMFPRGFLGADLQPQLVRSPDQVSSILTQKFAFHVDLVGLPGTSGKVNMMANPHVEGLYVEYIKKTIMSGSFEFRKKVLHAALHAFGTADFNIWFEAQFKTPACGDLHKRFLDDILKFIVTGRRDMSLENWGSLITITDEGDNIGSISDYAKDFFGIGKGARVHDRQNYLLTEIIQRWCSQPNGFEDLLGTLHILFGNVGV